MSLSNLKWKVLTGMRVNYLQNGWKLLTGISGNLIPESVESISRNAWKLYSGIGGKYWPEYAYREGNAMGGIVEAVESGYKVVESSGKKIKHFAGDSECYVADLINFLRTKGITFTIVADQDAAVKETIKAIPEEDWKPYIDKDGIERDREIAVTVHTMDKTEAFTLVVLR